MLELDAGKLDQDGLSFVKAATSHASKSRVLDLRVIRATSVQELGERLNPLIRRGRLFEGVVVVAHGNAAGIQASSDAFARWDEFPELLRPFRPERLLLVSCMGGRWAGVKITFERVPTLQQIVASPTGTTKWHAERLMNVLGFFTAIEDVPAWFLRTMQLLVAVGDGSQLRLFRRADLDDPSSNAWDAAAASAEPLFRRLPKIVSKLLS